MKTKVCRGCDKRQPVAQFNRRKRGKGGLSSRCKTCTNDYHRPYQRDRSAGKRAAKETVRAQLRARTEKTCAACGETKPLTSEFWAKHPGLIDGFRNQCKVCGESIRRERRRANPTKAREIQKQERSTDRYRNARAEKVRQRRANDLRFRFIDQFRRAVGGALARKSLGHKPRATFEILPYSTATLISHIEKQFTSGMTWKNYGRSPGWSLDHVRPCAAFHIADYHNVEDFIKAAFAINNLRPLWHHDNIKKNSTWNGRYWRNGVPVGNQLST